MRLLMPIFIYFGHKLIKIHGIPTITFSTFFIIIKKIYKTKFMCKLRFNINPKIDDKLILIKV